MSRILSSEPAVMTFLEHLDELRKRLLYSCLSLVVASVAAFLFADFLFEKITAPLNIAFANADLIGTGPAEAFLVKLKVSILGGLIISCPILFFQLWRFIAPGLLSHEKSMAGPFVVISSLFFLSGVSFCFYVVFPFAFEFFSAQYLSIGVTPAIRIGEYLGFALRMLIVFGLVFELPVFCYFLARLGLVNARWLIRNARYAVLATFILAAVLTPPDLITQFLLAGPLLVLYGLCIGVSYFAQTPKKPV